MDQKNKQSFSFRELIEKFNPYHDGLGRFSSKHGASSMTLMTSSAAGQKAINNIRAQAGVTSPGPDIKNAGKAAITPEESKRDIAAFENAPETYKVVPGQGLKYYAINQQTDDVLGTEWVESLNAKEQSAISQYTDLGYFEINELNRYGGEGFKSKKALKEAQSDSQTIESALDKASLATNTIVYRGSGAAMFSDLGIDMEDIERRINKGTFDASQLEGLTYTDKSFTSTSISPDRAFKGKDVSIKYLLPQGAKAAPIHSLSFVEKENEVLIQKGSKYLIHSANVVKAGDYGAHRVELVVEYIESGGGT